MITVIRMNIPGDNVGAGNWQDIRNGIAAQIRNGDWTPGEQLPTESELCRRFEAGRHSVRRAIQSLAIDGQLRVVQGGGTFVEHAPFVDYAIGRRTRFRKNLSDQGLTPAGEPIAAETVPATADLAEKLGVDAGVPVHRFLARGLADGVPISLGLSFHPAARFPDLLDQRKAGISVSEVYRGAGIADYLRKRTTVHTRRADPEEARLLRQHPEHPVLVVTKTDVTPDGIVIGHSESIWAGARVRLTFDLPESEEGDA